VSRKASAEPRARQIVGLPAFAVAKKFSSHPAPRFRSRQPAASSRRPALIPDQDVEADGAISVPYAGRIPAAGRLPTEVQQTIESRLARKALEPQALVIVKKTSGNTVTVAGEAGLAEGATAAERGTEMLMFPLAPGGDAQASKTGVLG
jgi:protein involved in polysaccharide export with SLBB domain